MSTNDKGRSAVSARKKEGFSSTVRTMRFAVSVVWQCAPVLLLGMGLATVFQGLGPTANIWVSKYVLNSIVEAVKSNGDAARLAAVLHVLALQLAILLLVMALNRITALLRSFLGKRLTLSMTADLLTRISRLDLLHFEDSHFYDMINRAMAESSARPLILIERVTGIVGSGITFLSMGGLIAVLSVPLFLSIIFLCVPYLFVQMAFNRRYYQVQYERTHDLRMASYLAGDMTNRRCVPEIISFGLWSFLLNKWLGFSRGFMRQDLRLDSRRTLSGGLAYSFLTLGTTVATAYIVCLGARRTPPLNVGDIMMYVGAFSGAVMALVQALDLVSGMHEGTLFLRNLVEFNELEPASSYRKTGKPVPEVIESVVFRNVSFRYPGRPTAALQNINLTFTRSESVLLVGPNGAGKTTLIKLLARLYDPTEGHILLNGVDIREYDLDAYRRKVGVIFQEFVRFALTARENIGCGCVDDLENEQRIVRAATQARADAFIRSLPRQYETILSKQFKEGQELSLGQWQRICMARLFMKDAPVLILDEPTASLDLETEACLLQEIARLSRDRLCILVSHRMFRQGIADQIVVLSKGRIQETGTYDRLLACHGEFARLCRLYHTMTMEQTDVDLTVSESVP